jgi:RHS repeat-associated protein
MLMPGRQLSSGYRFGFNGMEMDDEVKGVGSSYNTFFRIYDSRLGRWLSIDPIKQAAWSPYKAMGNNPLIYTDQNGDCEFCKEYIAGFKKGSLSVINSYKELLTNPQATYVKHIEAQVAQMQNAVNHYSENPRELIRDLFNGDFSKEVLGYDIREFILEPGSLDKKSREAAKEFTESMELISQGNFDKLGEKHGENFTNLAILFLTDRLLREGGKVAQEIKLSRITTEGVSAVETHLAQFGYAPENTIMINRLKDILDGKIKPTKIDKAFYKHEMREMQLMESGMEYNEAHQQTLTEQGMYVKEYEKLLYTQEALDAGDAYNSKQAGSGN